MAGAGPGPALNLNDLRDEAVTFALASWTWAADRWTMGPITFMQLNPGLANGCPALQNYCKGYELLRPYVQVCSRTFFAWHGTDTLANIASICHEGFSPAKRKRQRFGVGEYFGVVPEDSHGYTSNTDRLILVQIIRSNLVFTRKECHIVNNPINREYCFTLPVLVVTYNNKVPLAIPWIQFSRMAIPAPFTASQLPPSGETGPHTWHWTNDAAMTEPYGPYVGAILEHHYQQYLFGGPLAFLAALNLNGGLHYMFNFTNMTQRNIRTGFERRIYRVAEAQNSSPTFWFWREDNGEWIPFLHNLSQAIEQQYNCNVAGCTLEAIQRRKDKVLQAYHINFITMTQINGATGHCRKVRRGPIGGPTYNANAQSHPVAVPSMSQQPRPGASSINAGATDTTPLLGSDQDKPGVAFVKKWFCCFC